MLKTWNPPSVRAAVCAAVDVHYLSTGGARAAAVLAGDAAFAHVLADRVSSPWPVAMLLSLWLPGAQRAPQTSRDSAPAQRNDPVRA